MRRADGRETLPQRSRARLAAAQTGKTLAPTQQPLLAQLAAWRERVAQQKNLPRGWVVPDPALVDIARAQPGNPGQLAAIPGLEPALVRRFGGEILAIVDQGKRLAPQRLWQESARPEPEQQRLLDKVSACIQACAREHGVSATLLAPRREMVKFVLRRSRLRALAWLAPATDRRRACCATRCCTQTKQQLIDHGDTVRWHLRLKTLPLLYFYDADKKE